MFTKKSYYSLGLLFLIAIMHISCEDDIRETSIASNSAVIINGFMCPNDTTRINVSLIKNMWDYSKDSFICNAQVCLKTPDGSVLHLGYDTCKYHLWTSNKGFYKLPSLVPYKTGLYELSVTIPDKGTFVAKDSIPAAVPVKYCTLSYDSLQKYYSVQVHFSDPADALNYYSFSVNSFSYYTTWIYQHVGDSTEYNGCNRHYNVELSSQNTFVEAPVFSSLNQLVFSDKTFNGESDVALSAILEASFQGNYDSTVFSIQLHSVSKAYYNYAITYYKQNQAEKDFYAEPVSVYSNIEDGYGIFAGYNTSEAKIKYVKGKILYE